MGVYQFRQEQKIKASIDEIWEYISSPENLQEITPEYMGFKITSARLPEKVYPGLMISYKVSPVFGIKMDWLTEITHVKNKKYFVDEQRKGPYKLWHHEHFVEPTDGGVIMRDIVTYVPPFGWLGNLANFLLIRKKLNEIFEYRTLALEQKFGSL